MWEKTFFKEIFFNKANCQLYFFYAKSYQDLIVMQLQQQPSKTGKSMYFKWKKRKLVCRVRKLCHLEMAKCFLSKLS